MATKHSDSQVHRRSVDRTAIEILTRGIISALGLDTTTEGLRGTPRRVANFWAEFMEYDDEKLSTSFQKICTDQMVVVRHIPLWSVCEHHLLPFHCEVTIGYVAKEQILGLSKFARIAQLAAHRPQVQERLVHEIADAVESLTGSEDVAVIAVGEHTCMQMRGIRSPGQMITSVMRGCFYEEDSARAEFLQLAGIDR